MTIWDKIVKGLATLGGVILGFFGGWNAMLTILACVMVVDYGTGLIVAGFGKSPKTANGGISSNIGFLGLAKKGFIILIVFLATLLDKAINNTTFVFQMATTAYYIANEGISILENAGLMGVPIPPIIKNALEAMKKKGEEKEKE